MKVDGKRDHFSNEHFVEKLGKRNFQPSDVTYFMDISHDADRHRQIFPRLFISSMFVDETKTSSLTLFFFLFRSTISVAGEKVAMSCIQLVLFSFCFDCFTQLFPFFSLFAYSSSRLTLCPIDLDSLCFLLFFRMSFFVNDRNRWAMIDNSIV